MSARLTIAIPTYNRATLLKRALDSACAQTSQEIEILVSDNGSGDGTQALLAKYKDPRLRIIRHELTMPRAEHGTFIFQQIRTELVLALSDDDYIEPAFSVEILKLFDEHPEISFAYTGCMEHYDDAAMPALVGPRIESSLDFIAAHYAGQRQVSWCACVTRIKDILACGPQPPNRMIGDMFFWTQICFNGPVGCVAQPLSHYSVLRNDGDNESRAAPIILWAEEVNLLAMEVMRRVQDTRADALYRVTLQKNMQKYTVRSMANQFLWSRISGISRYKCFTKIRASMRFKGWTINSIIRVGAALILPRAILRHLVVQAAKKQLLKRVELQSA